MHSMTPRDNGKSRVRVLAPSVTSRMPEVAMLVVLTPLVGFPLDGIVPTFRSPTVVP